MEILTMLAILQWRETQQRAASHSGWPSARAGVPLGLGHLQLGHSRVGIMRKPNPIHAVGRFQLARYHQFRLIERLHYRAVDDARNLVALHLHRDLLRHRLSYAGGLVYRIARLAPSIQLKCIRPKPAHDEVPAAVRRAVDIALLPRP